MKVTLKNALEDWGNFIGQETNLHNFDIHKKLNSIGIPFCDGNLYRRVSTLVQKSKEEAGLIEEIHLWLDNAGIETTELDERMIEVEMSLDERVEALMFSNERHRNLFLSYKKMYEEEFSKNKKQKEKQ